MPKVVTDADKACALALHAQRVPLAQIAAQFGVHQGTISHWARIAGISRAPADACRRYVVDSNYFDVIDTEAKAYWLGFLYADGCVYKNRVRLALARKDREHIERFRLALGSTHRIRDTDYAYAESSIDIHDQQLVDGLISQGVVPKKTFSPVFPSNVPPPLQRAFVLGFFDGDGSITNTKKATVSWVGTWECLSWLSATLSEAVPGVTQRPLQEHHSTPGIWYLAYSGNRQASRIGSWMYQEAQVWLPRKRERFVALDVLPEWPDTSSRHDYLAHVRLLDVDELVRRWLEDESLSIELLAAQNGISVSVMRGIILRGTSVIERSRARSTKARYRAERQYARTNG